METTADLAWSHGSARVTATAAMLTELSLQVGGRTVHPLARAPWSPVDPGVAELPGHLRVLGGDFLALPFGSAEVPGDAPDPWRRAARPANTPAHGDPADLAWRLESHGDAVSATLTLPAHRPVERVRRRIRGVEGRARVEIDVDIVPRSTHRTSLGLHPILALPESGSARIDVAFDTGRVWPGRLHARSRPVPDAVFSSLDAVPTPAGRADLSIVPPPHPTEEVVQLVGARSPFHLHRDDGVTVVVEWDDELLPSLLLWLSDRALTQAPWSGAYRGLGVEPVASAFDFSEATSLAANPLATTGARTWIALEAGTTMTTTYAIEALV